MSDIKLTAAQRAALEYVSTTMGATAAIVGKRIIEKIGVQGGSGFSAVGAATLMHLRRKGYVFPSSMNGWRTTAAGRSALSKARGETQ
jgi:hypothetical protein